MNLEGCAIFNTFNNLNSNYNKFKLKIGAGDVAEITLDEGIYTMALLITEL